MKMDTRLHKCISRTRSKRSPLLFAQRPSSRNEMWRCTFKALFLIAAAFEISQASGAGFVDIGLEAVDSPSIDCSSSATLFEDGLSFVLPREGTGVCPWITSSSYYSGARAVGTRVLENSDPTAKDRCEIQAFKGADSYALHFGQTRYFGFAVYFNESSSDWPLDQDVIFMQAWQVNCGPKVPLVLSLQAGTGDNVTPLTFKVVAYEDQVRLTLLNSVPVTKGWHTFLIKMMPNWDEMCETGQLDLWLDGLKILAWSGNWGNEPDGYIKDLWNVRCGIYRPMSTDQDLYLIFDNIRYADNFCDAMP